MRNNWVQVKLIQVCEKASKVKRSETIQLETFIYLDISSIDNQINKIISQKEFTWQKAPSRAQQIVRYGDVLFSTVRTYLKNIALVDKPEYNNQIASSGFTVIRGKSGILDSRFMFYQSIYEGFLQPLNDLQTGSSYPAVRDKDVFDQVINLPPLPEQRAIVAKIEQLFSELDNGIANLKKAQEQLKIYRQAVLKKAFEGELTREWRYANIQSRDWKIVKLKDISERVSVGHVGPTSDFYCDEEDGIPFLRSQNVRKGKLSFSGLKYITKGFHSKLKKSQLKTGDLLIVRVGANRGDAVVLPELGYQVNCANIVFARVMNIDHAYLNYYFNSPYWSDLINSLTTGSAQGVINTKIVAEVEIPVPTPNEQIMVVQEIETRLSVCDKLEEDIQENLEKSEALRQSILKQAFEGKLLSQAELDACRREQDWEPAEKLLERIKVRK